MCLCVYIIVEVRSDRWKLGGADRGFKSLDWNEFNGVDLVLGGARM